MHPLPFFIWIMGDERINKHATEYKDIELSKLVMRM